MLKTLLVAARLHAPAGAPIALKKNWIRRCRAVVSEELMFPARVLEAAGGWAAREGEHRVEQADRRQYLIPEPWGFGG
jgi:hypothetical protein